MNAVTHQDPLSVVFQFLTTTELKTCEVVCRLWHAVSRQERRRRAQRLADMALTWVKANPGHLMLAGSMALWIFEGKPTRWFPNDADLFSYGLPAPPSTANEFDEIHHATHLAEKHISCDEHFYSYLCTASNFVAPHDYGPRPLIIQHETPTGTLQFILSSHFPTPASVVDSFDISCAMVGYTAPNVCIKGAQFTSPQFSAYYWQGIPRTKEEHTLSICQSVRTQHRAQKYAARGYTQVSDKNAAQNQMRFAVLYTLTKCSLYRTTLERNTSVSCQCKRAQRTCYFDTVITGCMLPYDN
tara:strand:+ start:142 stop:1038 length:897 start_codon:yes stop_codon:yes gene_type:complete